ncbi:hypothetical protein Hesp01_63350 [Herbidospora sp. NBRC 101105]|nr:hypothetical protein Hesp01_63350 [Herbidospora sp. NBRC 101105]
MHNGIDVSPDLSRQVPLLKRAGEHDALVVGHHAEPVVDGFSDESSERFEIAPLVTSASDRPRCGQDISGYAQAAVMAAKVLERVVAVLGP